MSLDVYVRKIVDLPEEINTYEMLAEFCEKHNCTWHECSSYSKSTKEIFLPEYDFDRAFSLIGKNVKEYEYVGSDDFDVLFCKKDGNTNNPEDVLSFDERKLPIKRRDEKTNIVVLSKEFLGHMNGGANESFYDSGKWDENTIVLHREEAEYDWKCYFSDTKQSKTDFKQKILDHFIEGETAIIYS